MIDDRNTIRHRTQKARSIICAKIPLEKLVFFILAVNKIQIYDSVIQVLAIDHPFMPNILNLLTKINVYFHKFTFLAVFTAKITNDWWPFCICSDGCD